MTFPGNPAAVGSFGGEDLPRAARVRQRSSASHPREGAVAQGAAINQLKEQIQVRDVGGGERDQEAEGRPGQRHGGVQQVHRREAEDPRGEAAASPAAG